MEDITALLIAPLIIFLIFVAPVWLVLHYRSKKQVQQGVSPEDKKILIALNKQAEVMSQRITTLESLLDAESPDWRTKQ